MRRKNSKGYDMAEEASKTSKRIRRKKNSIGFEEERQK